MRVAFDLIVSVTAAVMAVAAWNGLQAIAGAHRLHQIPGEISAAPTIDRALAGSWNQRRATWRE